jgi:transketolase
MALEDIAMMRAVHASTVLYPCDGNATAALVQTMADLPGISYLRTTREKTPVLYDPGDPFPVGGSKTLRSSGDDRVTLVGAGITVHEALAAAETLAGDGVSARVIDCYSIKPIDEATIRAALTQTGLLLTIEDHWIEGGLGDAVLAALAEEGTRSGRVVKVAVTEMPGSGTPQELRDWAGISARRIAERVRKLLA